MEDPTQRDLAELVGPLPDSRPADQRGQIRTPQGNATPVYCINCHRQFGYAWMSTEKIVYVCDECEKKHGGLPLPVVDEDYIRGRKES
jgi:NAD-dependent SIR2 family protein deacetylase